jgi:hypothetical protein
VHLLFLLVQLWMEQISSRHFISYYHIRQVSNACSCILQTHPFFKGIDWLNIHRYTAPFRPELRNPDDTRHFDPDIPAEVRIKRSDETLAC